MNTITTIIGGKAVTGTIGGKAVTGTIGGKAVTGTIGASAVRYISKADLQQAVDDYLAANPPTGGTGSGSSFKTDDTLTLKDGVLSVNTTDLMEQDNTLPITSAGVYATVGNIEVLLKTI